MLDQFLQVPVVRPTDIRNVPLRPELCPNPYYNETRCVTKFYTNSECKSRINATILDLNCYSFHNKIFKNAHEAEDFCKNAFGKYTIEHPLYTMHHTGELAFGHFPTHENEKLPGKSQIWTYAKPEFLHEIDEFLCSCQSSHGNTFIKLKDSSVCPKAKNSKVFDFKVCSSELKIRTVCGLKR